MSQYAKRETFKIDGITHKICKVCGKAYQYHYKKPNRRCDDCIPKNGKTPVYMTQKVIDEQLKSGGYMGLFEGVEGGIKNIMRVGDSVAFHKLPDVYPTGNNTHPDVFIEEITTIKQAEDQEKRREMLLRSEQFEIFDLADKLLLEFNQG